MNELRDYETSGGDLDAIRQHIDDAASARVWDMFLTYYVQVLRPDRVRNSRPFRED